MCLKKLKFLRQPNSANSNNAAKKMSVFFTTFRESSRRLYFTWSLIIFDHILY